MSEAAGNFDFMEFGQAIMDAREKQRITREELYSRAIKFANISYIFLLTNVIIKYTV